jgi:hypothetical protein
MKITTLLASFFYRTKEHNHHLTTVATKRITITITMPDEHKEMRQKSKKKIEVDMMALAPVATVCVLGSSNADHTNKRRFAACAKQTISPLDSDRF